MKLGRPVEIFDWFSIPIIRKGSLKRLRDLLDSVKINEEYTPDKHKRIVDLQFSSLIERVLTNDFHEYFDENKNFNRLMTLKDDGIWLEKHELL